MKISYFVTLGILPLIAAIFALINRIIYKPHFLPKVSDTRIRNIYNGLLQKNKKLQLTKTKNVNEMRVILGTSTFSYSFSEQRLDFSEINLNDKKEWEKIPGIPKNYLIHQIIFCMFPRCESLKVPKNTSNSQKKIFEKFVCNNKIKNKIR